MIYVLTMLFCTYNASGQVAGCRPSLVAYYETATACFEAGRKANGVTVNGDASFYRPNCIAVNEGTEELPNENLMPGGPPQTPSK
jgi:hypothetical protein